MKTLKINQTVFSKQHGEGTIVTIEGNKALVNFNGVEKLMLTMVLKTVAPKDKKVKVEVETVENFNSIVNNLKGTRQDRGSMFAFGDSIYNKLEKMADDQKHFAGTIIENARSGKFISDKQAFVVAYFAKNNSLIK